MFVGAVVGYGGDYYSSTHGYAYKDFQTTNGGQMRLEEKDLTPNGNDVCGLDHQSPCFSGYFRTSIVPSSTVLGLLSLPAALFMRKTPDGPVRKFTLPDNPFCFKSGYSFGFYVVYFREDVTPYQL
jgi:hypothetical protein